MKIFKKALLALFGSSFIALSAGMIYYFSVTAGVMLDRSALSFPSHCLAVFDSEGNLLTECTPDGTQKVIFEELPEHTVRSFLCAEDRRFFTHHGLEYKRMISALWKNIRSGSFKEGASTISQQLVKNTQLSPEKTIERKLKEWKLTKQLERAYTKNEILEMYLNAIYFGHNAFGIKAAAEFYFGKKVEELTIAQSAMLAGVIKSPNNYSPFREPKKCLERRNYILKTMFEEGYLDETEFLLSREEELPVAPHNIGRYAASYIDGVVDELSEIFPKEHKFNRLKIYTYLSPLAQRGVEQLKNDNDFDKSYCIIDNHTHGMTAFYSTIGQSARLPGSTVKPLLVYAPAIEENEICPATPILDEKTDFYGYCPKNFDGKYHGYVSCRTALSLSYNIPAVKILNSFGIERALPYLEKMRLPVDEDDRSLALALGGMKKGYSLADLCAAYSTFPNRGEYSSARFIQRIEDENGRTIYQHDRVSEKVFSEDTAHLINDMLTTVTRTGTAKKLKKVPYDVCAKTGTCGNENGNTDAYCIAYTADHTVGIWLGDGDNTPCATLTGGGRPTALNLTILNLLYGATPPAPLFKSKNVVSCTLDKMEYYENQRLLLCDKNAPVQEKTFKELFKKSDVPKHSSTYFSIPKLKKTGIYYKNNGVCIVLCHADYYSYIVNRRSDDDFKTIYQGNSIDFLVDDHVQAGKTYSYTVTPYYKQFVGETVVLPQITIPHKKGSATSRALHIFFCILQIDLF